MSLFLDAEYTDFNEPYLPLVAREEEERPSQRRRVDSIFFSTYDEGLSTPEIHPPFFPLGTLPALFEQEESLSSLSSPPFPERESPVDEQIIASCGIFIVNKGEMIITPAPEERYRKLTLKVGSSYVKMRQITVYTRSEMEKAEGTSFNPNKWFHIGSEGSELFLNKEQIVLSYSHVKDKRRARLIEQAFFEIVLSPSTVTTILAEAFSQFPLACFFTGFSPSLGVAQPVTGEERYSALNFLKTKKFKITTLMSFDGRLRVVASRVFTSGSCKIIKETRALWIHPDTCEQRCPSLLVFAKGKPRNSDRKSFEKEADISQFLLKRGVPYILDVHTSPRSDLNKVNIVTSFCPLGDLFFYVKKHFSQNRELQPAYRAEHIKLALQVAKSLAGMHAANLVHGDVKLPNVLITLNSLGESEIRLCDFGLTSVSGKKVAGIPGTFPPPETLWNISSQRQCSFVMELRDGALFALPSSPPVQKRSFVLNEGIDVWAYGVLLLGMMHHPYSCFNFSYEVSYETLMKAWDELSTKLSSSDPVDVIITQLLAKDPSQRISLQRVVELLSKAN